MATTDLSAVEAAIRRIEQGADDIIDRVEASAQTIFAALVRAQMHTGQAPPRGVPNSTDKLYVRTGNLLRSFLRGETDNAVTEKRSKMRRIVLIGSSVRYAAVHEFGGSKVRARPYVKPAAAVFAEQITPLARLLTDWVVTTWNG
jgi:phage gpG-like protein